MESGLFGQRKYWATRFGVAPVLPRTRAEMDALGWDSCDVIIVSGDAYVDHPSFGAGLVGRLLEAQGFRVGIIDQPDWRTTEPMTALGAPNLMFGVTAGNMDSLVNHFTSDKKPRSDDAYTPGGVAGKRPDRACIVYAQRCREAYPDVPIVIGGIEASLRRIAHYDYWSDKVRRSVLLDSGADLLVYGNGERQIVEIVQRLGRREPIASINDVRGTAMRVRELPDGFLTIDSRSVDAPGPIEPHRDPYAMEPQKPEGAEAAPCETSNPQPPAYPQDDVLAATQSAAWTDPAVPLITLRKKERHPRNKTAVRMPSYEDVKRDPVLYAHASRILHTESNPHNARALVQRHGTIDIFIHPPALPLTSAEMDRVYELPYSRLPHPAHEGHKIPAYEMIRFSITINRGCFGGCSFCSITEHEGRIIQSRSEESVLREVERVRDTVPGFTGVISDLGGPTANMYRLACKDPKIEAACRKPSCVYPDVCENLGTDHGPLIKLYRKARALPGIKKVLIASGIRYDLAVKSPEYVKELASHHVGGYLKIAPEHTRQGPLSLMMKPGIGTYEKFKELFDKFSKQAGKEQYLIPYFIAAHPGTTDEDMLALALWLKEHGFRADQVQAFLPSPMASATAMYHTGKNPLRRLRRDSGEVVIPKSPTQRKLHKAFLRYHDPNNWPVLREALMRMGRKDLIGYAKKQLIPPRQPANWQPPESQQKAGPRSKKQPAAGSFRTQHTGLPPSTDSRARKRRGAAPR